MLKRLLIALALLAAGISTATAATIAVSTGNVNLRAGPSTAYPVVTTVPVGMRIVTHGCLAGYTWCDIAFGPYRGWVSSNYIQIVFNGAPVVLSAPVATSVGITVVAFNQAYWNNYYRAYPWYGSWNTYYGAYPAGAPARIDSYGRSVTCANGNCAASSGAMGIYGGATSQNRSCSGGECTSNRNSIGPYGNSGSRVRTCSANDFSCDVTRTGPRGGTVSGTRTFERWN